MAIRFTLLRFNQAPPSIALKLHDESALSLLAQPSHLCEMQRARVRRKERNMKRIVKILFVIFLLFALAGCTVRAAGPKGAGASGASAQAMPLKDKQSKP
jgi:hypothetical protein